MAQHDLPPSSARHPSPQRHRVGLAALFFGLAAAPLGWNVQLLLSTALSGHACYPRDVPLAVPAWSGTWGVLLAIGVAGLALAAAGGLVSWRNWRRTRGESAGAAERLFEVGEGRTRFLAMFGLLASFLFAIGIVFATAGVLLVPLCR
jgi:hypothetical protein